MHDRIRDRKREVIRDEIISNVWSTFTLWGLGELFGRAVRWFTQNVISFGIFATWPTEDDGADAPIGRRVGILSIDSHSRLVVVGWARLDRRDLTRLVEQGRVLRLRVLGWLRIAKDVDASLAAKTLESVRVVGASRVPPGVRSRVA